MIRVQIATTQAQAASSPPEQNQPISRTETTIEYHHRLVCEVLQVAVEQGRLCKVDGGYLLADAVDRYQPSPE